MVFKTAVPPTGKNLTKTLDRVILGVAPSVQDGSVVKTLSLSTRAPTLSKQQPSGILSRGVFGYSPLSFFTTPHLRGAWTCSTESTQRLTKLG